MENRSFVVFILSHGRPDSVETYKTLRKQKYTGDVYIVVDNEDETVDRYYENFGEDKVIVFDKKRVAETFDEADNFGDRRTVVYARNACFEIAEELGYEYFLELDDDYAYISYVFNSDLQYFSTDIKALNLDKAFDVILEYYKSIPAVSVAFGQTGDFIGGKCGRRGQKVMTGRKAMNSFFCSTKRPFRFLGRVNEDVNTYVRLGNTGMLFLTVFNMKLRQGKTQASSGGMTELYMDEGTYIKSFYPVMFCPSCVKIATMGATEKRIHHQITWQYAVPCILREELRKARENYGGKNERKQRQKQKCDIRNRTVTVNR